MASISDAECDSTRHCSEEESPPASCAQIVIPKFGTIRDCGPATKLLVVGVVVGDMVRSPLVLVVAQPLISMAAITMVAAPRVMLRNRRTVASHRWCVRGYTSGRGGRPPLQAPSSTGGAR